MSFLTALPGHNFVEKDISEMGRAVRETAVVDVIINGESARKRVGELTSSFNDLREAKLRALKAGNTELAKSIQKEMTAIRKELWQYEKATIDVEHVLRNLNNVPLNQLQAAQQLLRRRMQQLNRDSVEYLETQRKVLQIERELRQATTPRSGVGISRSGAFIGGAAVTALLERVGQKAIDTYTELDDKMADVQKTTGRTKEEVIALDAELMKIDTRTDRLGLLDTARIGGKLGVDDPDELLGFVKAADQINVALSEDLGGNVEEAIRQLGKLVDIFHLKEELGLEKSLLSVGSAINSLGAASTANEGYLVEFTNRAAGVAPAAGVSIQNTLGLAAALDQLGQTAEVSGTTYSQVMSGMQKNTSQYAAIAGMSLQEFRKLLNEDANEAFLRFLEGVNGDGGMEGITKRLASLKLEGARATQVLGVLAQNVDMVREQQTLSNKEFASATSIYEEYNTKNQSAQAILEKRQKVQKEALATLGEQLMPLWSEAIGFAGQAMKVFSELVGWGVKNKGVLISLAAAYITHNTLGKASVAIKKLEVFWSKANRAALAEETVALGKATASTKLMSAAKNLLAGNIRAAGAAFKMFIASMGPIGWATIAVGALGTAWALLPKRISAAEKAAKDLAEVNKRANDTYVEEKMRLEDLMRVAKDKQESDENRKSAIKQLQEVIPDGIKLINEETIATGKAQEAVDRYCDSLLLRAKLEAGKDVLVELEKERLNALADGSAAKLNFWQKIARNIAASDASLHRTYNLEGEYAQKNLQKFEADMQSRQSILTDQIKKWKEELDAILAEKPVVENDNKNPSGFADALKGAWTPEKDEAFLAAKIELHRKLMEGEIASEEEYNRQVVSLEIEAYEQRLTVAEEKGADRLRLQAALAEKRYQQQKNEQTRLQRLMAAATEGGAKTDYEQRAAREKAEYEKRLRELGLFGRKREDMTAQELAALENLERNNTLSLRSIYMDAFETEFRQRQQAFTREIQDLKISHNNEMAEADSFGKKMFLLRQYYSDAQLRGVRTDREADRLLRAYYQKTEQDATREHLESLIKQYSEVLSGANSLQAGGIILTQQEKERVQEIVDDLNKQLGELRGSVADPSVQHRTQKVDILGFTQDDWKDFFTKLAEGESGIWKWKMALQAIGTAFGEVNNLMTASENRELAQYEKSTDKRKKALDRQLQSGSISQERYNAAVQEMDERTAQKREEIERRQAIRQKEMAIFQIGINTAMAIMKLWAESPGFPMAIPLTAMVTALAAVQLAAVLKTPVPGAEEGGEIGVTREQDGRPFRARWSPRRRGYIGSPTVLVAEDGPEYVVPAEALSNPSIRPVLDIIERARRAGTLASIDLQAIEAASVPGRAAGGYIGSDTSLHASATTFSASAVRSDEDRELLRQMHETLRESARATDELRRRLDNGIEAYATITGPRGIKKQLEYYEKIKRNSRA